MSNALLLILIVIGVSQITWALRRDAGVLEYPFLIGCVYIAWLAPQAYRVSHLPTLPQQAVNGMLVMLCLCSIAGYVGYMRAGGGWHPNKTKLDGHKLVRAAIIMAAIGAWFFWKLSRLPEEDLARGQWAGRPVLYLFFANFLVYAWFIALAVYLHTGTRLALIPLAIAIPFFVERIIISARRGQTIEIVLGSLALVWFGRKWHPPKALVVFALPIVVILINGIGIYRGTVFAQASYGVTRGVLEDIGQRVANGVHEVAGNVDKLILPEEFPELLNATMCIYSIETHGDYDVGMSLWNSFVRTFVPGQLLGYEFKQGLYLPDQPKLDARLGYQPPTGSTFLGITDAFASFYYFGCLNFFAIGYAMRYLWENAVRGGFTHQLVYAIMVRHSLEALTHSTHRFAMGGLELLLIVGPLIVVAQHQRLRVTGNESRRRV